MKRILLFCRRDWLVSTTDRAACYAHEVFSRIGAKGNYVAWVAHRPFSLTGRRSFPRIEQADHIQIARLGPAILYPKMTSMFLNRLQRKKPVSAHYDIVVDFVQKRPLPLFEQVDIPVLPVIFGLAKGIHASADAPGPVIATNPSIRDHLEAAGFPKNLLINAFFPDEKSPQRQNPSETNTEPITWDQTANRFLSVIENLHAARRDEERDVR